MFQSLSGGAELRWTTLEWLSSDLWHARNTETIDALAELIEERKLIHDRGWIRLAL